MENYNEKYPGLDTTPLTPGQYALYTFLAGLPLIGLILLFVWAFSASGNLHQKNWAKGLLLLMAIVYGIVIFSFIFLGGMGIFAGILSNN